MVSDRVCDKEGPLSLGSWETPASCGSKRAVGTGNNPVVSVPGQFNGAECPHSQACPSRTIYTGFSLMVSGRPIVRLVASMSAVTLSDSAGKRHSCL